MSVVMLFDASSFHESLFKRNLCLVLFGCISSHLHLISFAYYSYWSYILTTWKISLFEAELFVNLFPSGKTVVTDMPFLSQTPNSAHLAQATTIFSEPPPWDSYLNQAAFFFRGFLVTDFRYKNSKSRDLPLTNTHTQRRSPNFYMEEIKFPIQQKILRLSPKLLRQWRPASTGVTTKSLDHVKIEKRMDWLDQCKWTHFGLGFKSKWSVF